MHLISRKELIDFEITAVRKKGVSRRAMQQLRPRQMMDGDAYGVSQVNEARINEGGRGEDGRARGREERFEIDESVATWKSWGARATPRMCIRDPHDPFLSRFNPRAAPLCASFCRA